MSEVRIDDPRDDDEGELAFGTEGAQTLLWQVVPDGLDVRALAERAAAVFEALGHGASSAAVVLVDDAQIAQLNAQYRGLDEPTDVLSFSMLEGEGQDFGAGLLGDVVVSLEYARRLVEGAQASAHRERVAAELGVEPGSLSWDLLDEVTFLVIHGALHLVGHDHAEPEDEARMKAEECRLMRPWLRGSVV